jgi:hypothetical protein
VSAANAWWSPARARIRALSFTSEVWHCGSQLLQHHRCSKFVGEFLHQAGLEPATGKFAFWLEDQCAKADQHKRSMGGDLVGVE